MGKLSQLLPFRSKPQFPQQLMNTAMLQVGHLGATSLTFADETPSSDKALAISAPGAVYEHVDGLFNMLGQSPW